MVRCFYSFASLPLFPLFISLSFSYLQQRSLLNQPPPPPPLIYQNVIIIKIDLNGNKKHKNPSFSSLADICFHFLVSLLPLFSGRMKRERGGGYRGVCQRPSRIRALSVTQHQAIPIKTLRKSAINLSIPLNPGNNT